MTKIDKWDENEMWDCVADGPLTPALLAELVQACDQRPELWKRCALVLLEDQLLRHELQSLATEQLVSNSAVRDKPVAGLVHQRASLPCPANAGCDGIDPLDARPASRSAGAGAGAGKQFWNAWAMAALLLIAMGIGWQASQRFGLAGRANVPEFGERGASMDLADSQLPIDLARPEQGDAMLAHTDNVDPDVIDQFNVETLTTAMQVDWKANLDPEYQQLRERGYDVESQEGLIPVWLYDGRSAVIPYQQIKLRSKSSGRVY